MEQINYNDLLAFVLAGFALTGSPGPATLSLAAMGASYGFKESRRYLLGLMFGVMCVVVGVAAGIFVTILALPGAAEVLTVVAMFYLGYLAFKIATAPPIKENTTPIYGPGFLAGFVLNLSNPKAYAAFTALFSGFQLIPQSPTLSTYLQVFICFVILFIVNPSWLYAGVRLRTMLRNEKINRRVNIAFAILLVVSVLFVGFL